ncbi:glycosyl hydrolase 18 family protein [Pleurotus pulmonarius]
MFHRTKTAFTLLAFVYSAVLCAPVTEYNEQVGFSANGPAGSSAIAGANAHIQPKPILNALQQAARPEVDGSAMVAEEDPHSASASSSYMPPSPSTVAQEPTTSVAEQAQVTPTAVTSTSSASSSSVASSSTASHVETTSSAPVSATSSVPSPSLTALDQPVETPMVMGYYPDWVGDSYPPEQVDFFKYDWIDFAFVEPGSDQKLHWDDDERSPQLLKRLTTAAHEKGSKVKLSIGGWAGSRFFSSAVSTEETRQRFVDAIVELYLLVRLDGIDIDWEYPAKGGETGNEVSAIDSANFLAFLRLLRKALPADAKISAATQSFPFATPEGLPMTNVTEFAAELDWITLMNYDVWGASADNPGPNAPFFNSCGNSTQPEASALAGFTAWTAAGFPASKIVLGVPSYGYISRSNAQTLRQRSQHERKRHSSRRVQGSREVARDDGLGVVHVVSGDGGDQVQFRDMVKQGALVQSGPTSGIVIPIFVGGGGFVRQWDQCSQTPFLVSAQGQGQVISYDDPHSLKMKSEFVKQTGMLGVNMFDIHGDTENSDLTNAIISGLGLDEKVKSD